MSSIYILSQGGNLTRKETYLVYTDRKMSITRILPFKTEHLVLVGSVSISGEAMRLIRQHEIPVMFMGTNGSSVARLTYQDSKNIFLRQKQFQLLDDRVRSLEIAKSIVLGKIKNQLTFMQRIKRSRGSKSDLDTAVKTVKNAIKDVEKCKKVETLRGLEGNVAKSYFSAFECNLIPEWAIFGKRSRNPPETNVNAVLSFLYYLLGNYVTAAILSQGLDTMAACMHELNYGRDVLTFDLMEEFRSPIVDTLTCFLFNKGILSKDDFRKQDFSSESKNLPANTLFSFTTKEEDEDAGRKIEAIYLTEDGMRKVVEHFEEKVRSAVIYAPLKKKLSFLEIMMEQSKMYKRVVTGEEAVYSPFYYR